jgi:hypothetical protein
MELRGKSKVEILLVQKALGITHDPCKEHGTRLNKANIPSLMITTIVPSTLQHTITSTSLARTITTLFLSLLRWRATSRWQTHKDLEIIVD